MSGIRQFDTKTLNLIRQQLAIPSNALPKLNLPRFRYHVPNESIIEAAVIVPLCYSRNGTPSLLFEERSHKLKNHRGEVCFPGGKVDPTDISPVATALRETEEEIGIPSSCISILGALPSIPNGTFTMRIHPFVAYIHSDPNNDKRAQDDGPRQGLDLSKLKLSHDEVHRAFTLPLSHFYDPSKQTLMDFRKTSTKIPVYDTDRHDLNIWGLTAFILQHLFLRLDCTLEDIHKATSVVNNEKDKDDKNIHAIYTASSSMHSSSSSNINAHQL